MGLADNFEKQLYGQARIHAAWFPVANTFRVGTYGVVEGGVMRPLGHISDLGIEVGELETSLPAGGVSFQSDGIKTVRTVAGVEVTAYPPGDIEAELRFEFTRADSVLFKADSLVEERMPDVPRVARELSMVEEWKRLRYRVVSSVYRANAPVVLVASDAETDFTFSGKVSALKAIEAGNANVSVSLDFSNKRRFHSTGKAGVVGLSLFRLGLGGRLRTLEAAGETELEPDATLDDDL